MRTAIVLSVASLLAGCASASLDTPSAEAPSAVAVEVERRPPAPEPAAPAPDDGRSGVVPPLVDLDLDQMRESVTDLGVAVQVVAFEQEASVTATYPAAGEPLPPGSALVVWLGEAPLPPPPPEPAPEPEHEAPPADPELAEAPDETDKVATGSEGTSAGQRDEDAPDEASTTASGRTSPRRMESTVTGTALEGPASWYGPGFEGRRTACGDRYDSRELTLATRELQCGTRVTITGPSGRSVEAVANDWGPAEWTGRRFDLSRATFEAVADLGRGVVPVTVVVTE